MQQNTKWQKTNGTNVKRQNTKYKHEKIKMGQNKK